MTTSRKRWLLAIAITVVGIGGAFFAWQSLKGSGRDGGFVSGNGRIEATEYNIASKRAGRIATVLVAEGDMVQPGQVLARMDTQDLEADLREAQAQLAQAREDKRRALAVVTQRENELRGAVAAISQRQSELRRTNAAIAQRQSELRRADAAIAQRQSELDLARKELDRAQALLDEGMIARQRVDEQVNKKQTAEAALAQERAARQAAEGALAEAEAQRQSAQSAIVQQEAQRQAVESTLAGARIDIDFRDAAIEAAAARIQKITTEIADSTLKSPVQGRVQYRVAQPGEVLGAGGPVLNLIDLSDVYLTFFLPTAAAGRVAIGTEVRLVLDAVPQYVIPAQVSFVADVAQFTPKTVETASEREKLMFRVKAQIPPDLLKKHITNVKTGLPGVAHVRLDPKATWPAALQVKLPQ